MPDLPPPELESPELVPGAPIDINVCCVTGTSVLSNPTAADAATKETADKASTKDALDREASRSSDLELVMSSKDPAVLAIARLMGLVPLDG